MIFKWDSLGECLYDIDVWTYIQLKKKNQQHIFAYLHNFGFVIVREWSLKST